MLVMCTGPMNANIRPNTRAQTPNPNWKMLVAWPGLGIFNLVLLNQAIAIGLSAHA